MTDPDHPTTELSAEDRKLVTLARSVRARTGGAEGAAIRDADGRTYAGATVDLTSLRLSALQVCLGMAVSSGVKSLEAAVVLTAADELTATDLAALAEVGGAGVVIHLGDQRGGVRATLTS